LQTIGARLDARQGIGPGFDFLRIFLAVAVVAWHAPVVVHGTDYWTEGPVLRLGSYAILTSFFSLSGFLISGSALRLSLPNFLVNRGLRIMPALGVEVILSALVLGPIFTVLTLGEYFSSKVTISYFTNLVGLIKYSLPGVFETHPTVVVNRSLWTVPHEIICYVIMAGLMLFGLLRRKWLVLLTPVAVLLLSLGLQQVDFNPNGANPLLRQFFRSFGTDAVRLFVGFLLGIVIYLFRDRVPYSHVLAGVCAVWCVALSLPAIDNFVLTNVLLGPAVAYLTAYIGVTDIPMPKLLTKGDYSYGIYLYGWPIQQVTYYFIPNVSNALVHFVVALPLIILFAAFSWHAIEKPILGTRKRFSFIARVRLDDAQASAAVRPPVTGAGLNASKEV